MENKEQEVKDEALIASELLYRRVFETAQDGILILNFDTGMITSVNKFLTDLLGFSEENLLNKYLWDVGAFKDVSDLHDNFLVLQTKGYIRFEDLPLETSDGRKIDVEFVANAYTAGGVRVIQCNIRDITFRKKAERELKDHYEKIETLNRLMVGRELKMVELKKEIQELKVKIEELKVKLKDKGVL